jgi:hypothetical protein
MAVTEQRVQHEVALNNTTTSFHYIKHKRNDELQLIITVVCATGSLPLTPFIQLSAKKAFKASSPLHRNQGERAYKVIQIRRPRKLQQICGREQEYKEHVIFLTHLLNTYIFLVQLLYSWLFHTFRKRHKAFRIYSLLLPPPPKEQLFLQQHDCFTHSSQDHRKIQAPKQ